MKTEVNTELDCSHLDGLIERVCHKMQNGEPIDLTEITDDPKYRARLAKLLPMLEELNVPRPRAVCGPSNFHQIPTGTSTNRGGKRTEL